MAKVRRRKTGALAQPVSWIRTQVTSAVSPPPARMAPVSKATRRPSGARRLGGSLAGSQVGLEENLPRHLGPGLRHHHVAGAGREHVGHVEAG